MASARTSLACLHVFKKGYRVHQNRSIARGSIGPRRFAPFYYWGVVIKFFSKQFQMHPNLSA